MAATAAVDMEVAAMAAAVMAGATVEEPAVMVLAAAAEWAR